MVKRRLWIGGCFFLFLAVAALALIYWSAVSGPRFYRQALQLELVSSRRLGDELEDITLASHNAAIRESMWSISFSDQQLNGWLATHLRNKYPKFYPKGMANLCTSFEGGKVRVAFRVENQVIPAVICLEVVPFLTQDEKSLALRIEKVYAGWVPISKKKTVDQVTVVFAKFGIPIAWTDDGGQPLGLTRPALELPKEVQRQLLLTRISLVDRHLVISGRASDSG